MRLREAYKLVGNEGETFEEFRKRFMNDERFYEYEIDYVNKYDMNPLYAPIIVLNGEINTPMNLIEDNRVNEILPILYAFREDERDIILKFIKDNKLI